MFQPVESNVNFPKLEEEILRFWRAAKIYEKSLARRADQQRFVFYEGPPTANGMPHPGHCLTRAIKDLFPRYRTMRGYLCERKAGWDTHGLPVEVEVCKELGIHSKEEIENYGIEPFIQKCQQSVWRYMQEWERLTERIGFWVDLKQAYVTYHQSYVESVWWSLKQLFDRGLLYQGYKIVWWWAQGGTSLSAGEVGLGYREVADPSVYVKFPLVSDERTKELGLDGASLLVWTTTPWTLPSNQFAAVHPDLEYAVVVDDEAAATSPPVTDQTVAVSAPHRLIIASALVETIAAKVKRELKVEKTIRGKKLIGLRYGPPFNEYYEDTPSTAPNQQRQTWGNRKGRLKTGGEDFLAWRILPGDFVTTDSGTGVVHIAPAFGEDDFKTLWSDALRFQDGVALEPLCPVKADGKFNSDGPEYCRGRWVKDCDKDIIHDLKNRGLLFHREEYRHEYPFCWRAEEDPLIQYPRRSWFIKTSESKQKMLDNNQHINWLPEHIKHGRFGNFLETNVDWALSRERFWGTPLPIWVCEKTGKMEAIANYEELLKKPGIQGTEVWDAAKKANPKLADDLKVHKPYIDAVTYDSPFEKGARMRRVTEVIDCWYDSGAMPFAQWGYQGEEQAAGSTQQAVDTSASRPLPAARFHEQFPADFISEALDQTRGWFYSQLAISTLVFDQPIPRPFRNCIVLGLMLGEDGQKMSKSKRNYREPGEIFDKYGADALRWYFFATQPPWTTIRYSERAIRDSIPEFLLRLWHTYGFFVIYANIDGFDPLVEVAGSRQQTADSNPPAASGLTPADLATAKSYRSIKDRSELDRWILSELNRTAAAVVERMDAYDNYTAAQQIIEFVDALSNWYVRRSRDRFWAEDKRDPDKIDAYWTLYECLLTTAKIIAPFVPFLAEAMWRNLAGGGQQAAGNPPAASRQPLAALESVHLCDFPTGDAAAIDEALSAQMNLVREIASLGLSARMGAKLKVRQPLAKVEVILVNPGQQAWLDHHKEVICKELNVKQVEFTQKADQYITYTVLPDLKRLGPRLGKKLPLVKQALAKADGGKLLAEMEAAGKVALQLDDGSSEALDREDLQVRLQAKPGWAAAQGKHCVVVLATEISPELVIEGVAREIVHAIQTCRKDKGCEYTDRIEVGVVSKSAEIDQALKQFGDYIRGETLAVTLKQVPIEGVDPMEMKLGDESLQLYVQITPKKN
ncbi:MAG TPA: isoleucine--tRNA ligase [Pirellulales bacterium]|nr:isoleucine--tRNA ligase [Pirellulales bacterium]